MTKEEKKKLADKVRIATAHIIVRWGCVYCDRRACVWEKYPDHVLMEILVDPSRLKTVGCSLKRTKQ